MAQAKKKITRKQLLKKDDAFLNAASQGAKWISENRMQVVAASVLAVAVILGTWGVVEYVRARDQEASVLFKRGLDLLDGEVLGVASEEEPNPSASQPTFGTEQEKWTAARDQFIKVTEETGGSGVAKLAAILAADLNEKLGDKEAAQEQFLALAGEMSASDSLHFLAVERAAYLQEASGDVDGALRTLSKLVNVQAGFYNDFASFHQARLYMGKGDNTRARNILERIEDDFPSSPILEDVRERLEQLGPTAVEETDVKVDEAGAEGAKADVAETDAEADAAETDAEADAAETDAEAGAAETDAEADADAVEPTVDVEIDAKADDADAGSTP